MLAHIRAQSQPRKIGVDDVIEFDRKHSGLSSGALKN